MCLLYAAILRRRIAAHVIGRGQAGGAAMVGATPYSMPVSHSSIHSSIHPSIHPSSRHRVHPSAYGQTHRLYSFGTSARNRGMVPLTRLDANEIVSSLGSVVTHLGTVSLKRFSSRYLHSTHAVPCRAHVSLANSRESHHNHILAVRHKQRKQRKQRKKRTVTSGS
ncbi:hypothetical protein BC831DRAFT_249575 [Entophlyctis helioformis]|nr:hypothetical protein BC831DRAFT_249575 [Entophlyctis helioformis]